jgi:hypothetical protein
MKTCRRWSILLFRTLAAGLLLLWAGGCGDRNAMRVQLQAHTPPGGDPGRPEIRAQVTGAQAGLRYKWFSVAGECEPQESEWPATFFKFPPGAVRDRVSVEVWRGNTRVAQSEIDVRLDEERARVTTDRLPKIQIEITNIPPYEPEGGPDTRADIGGRVSGELAPEFKVVIYARADAWYCQPTSYATHPIGSDHTWSSWTHTGSSYAALVVRPGFDPFLRLDVLPQVGGHVLARAIVEGARK